MLINIITFTIGLLGAWLVTFGAWLILPAAGYITAGGFCLLWSWLASQAAARMAIAVPPADEEEDR